MKDEPSFLQSRIVGLIRQGHMTGKEVATLRAQLNDVRDELRDAQKQSSEPSSLRADFGDMCLRIQELSQENAELRAILRETREGARANSAALSGLEAELREVHLKFKELSQEDARLHAVIRDLSKQVYKDIATVQNCIKTHLEELSQRLLYSQDDEIDVSNHVNLSGSEGNGTPVGQRNSGRVDSGGNAAQQESTTGLSFNVAAPEVAKSDTSFLQKSARSVPLPGVSFYSAATEGPPMFPHGRELEPRPYDGASSWKNYYIYFT